MCLSQHRCNAAESKQKSYELDGMHNKSKDCVYIQFLSLYFEYTDTTIYTNVKTANYGHKLTLLKTCLILDP